MTTKSSPLTKPPVPSRHKGKSADEFRKLHDPNYIVPKRIKDALAALGDGWEYEIEFLRLAGISTTQLGQFREQFEDHIVLIGGRNPKKVWAGTVKLAEELRGMAG
jgi:hypothetical protein